MPRIVKRLAILLLIVFFAFGTNIDSFARRGGFSRSSRSRSSFSRSSRKSYGRSSVRRSSSPRRTTRSKPKTTTTRKAKPTTTKSVSKSYGKSNYSRSTTTPKKSSTFGRSSSSRQKKQAMSKARTSSAVSTKGMSSREKRSLKSKNRKYTRQLKAENRSLKRRERRAERNTAYNRRQNRIINQTVVVNRYPVMTYNPLWTMASIMAFNNLYMGIHFRDHYNHALHHSWLWHYHHSDYDRSHWSRKREMEYARWRAYYDSQGIKQNQHYVDPGTHKDEDYTQSYIDQKPDEFYGANAQEYTVDQLPDESEVPQLIEASEKIPVTSQPVVRHETRTVVVKKKTSGGMWFVLIFGAILIIGIIVLVMYNKGYF